jgi:hypothetical protein
MCTPYYELLRANGAQILQRLYPHDFAAVDCPAAADAVDDYLTTGEQPQIDEDYRPQRYDISARWVHLDIGQLIRHVRNLGDCRHVVVRGSRSPATQRRLSLTATHFFVLANIHGEVYVVDAMTREVSANVRRYVRRGGFNRLEYTEAYEARPAIEY